MRSSLCTGLNTNPAAASGTRPAPSSHRSPDVFPLWSDYYLQQGYPDIYPKVRCNTKLFVLIRKKIKIYIQIQTLLI